MSTKRPSNITHVTFLFNKHPDTHRYAKRISYSREITKYHEEYKGPSIPYVADLARNVRMLDDIIKHFPRDLLTMICQFGQLVWDDIATVIYEKVYSLLPPYVDMLFAIHNFEILIYIVNQPPYKPGDYDVIDNGHNLCYFVSLTPTFVLMKKYYNGATNCLANDAINDETVHATLNTLSYKYKDVVFAILRWWKCYNVFNT